jgi:hypothetical protein
MPRGNATADQSTLLREPASVPSGTHPRVALPGVLVDAIAAALDREARESNLHARAELLACVRGVTEGWLAGALTVEDALDALAASDEPKSGIALRPWRLASRPDPT